MAHYAIVYDATREVSTVPPWLLLLLLPLVVAFAVWARRRGAISRLVALSIVVVPGGAVLVLATTLGTTDRLARALRQGTYDRVYGTVVALTPGEPTGHGYEVVAVRTATETRTYRYSPFASTCGFAHTVGRGGPMRLRAQVFIADVDGCIARLGIAPPVAGAGPTAPPNPAPAGG